jgi:hypothetical protein
LVGYRTKYYYTLYDQFGHSIPGVPVNETISTFTNDYSPCWGWPNPWTASNTTDEIGVFYDWYSVSLVDPIAHPETVYPFTTGWQTLVRHAQQWYCAGSLVGGEGYPFNTHTIQLYRGCALYQ